MNFPIEIYTIIIECLLIFYFFHKEVRPVYPSRRYIILFCISLFAVIMLSTLYTPMFIRLVIISLFLFFCYTFCFKCKIFQITYTIILFFVTSMFSDVIGAFVLSRLGISINELLGISEGRLIYNTTSKIIHLFLLVIIILFTNARFDSKALLHAIPLMLCNLSSIFILFAQYTTFIDNGKYSTFVMTTICMLVINIVVCGYTEIVKKSYELQKNQLCMQEQLAKQELYYQNIIARQDESRALWHDIKKYMLAMENLVSTKTRPEAESQLSALKKKFSSLDQMIDTGNSIVDGILNYGSNKADSLGISINFNLWLDTDLNISPVDLYIIIGNTMDNAIEACDAFPAGHKPSISCTLRQKNHVLLYEISNPIPQVSVKKAGVIHGYGLENVKECVNRNSGFISIKNENDIFCVSITLNV